MEHASQRPGSARWSDATRDQWRGEPQDGRYVESEGAGARKVKVRVDTWLLI